MRQTLLTFSLLVLPIESQATPLQDVMQKCYLTPESEAYFGRNSAQKLYEETGQGKTKNSGDGRYLVSTLSFSYGTGSSPEYRVHALRERYHQFPSALFIADFNAQDTKNSVNPVYVDCHADGNLDMVFGGEMDSTSQEAYSIITGKLESRLLHAEESFSVVPFTGDLLVPRK